MGEGNESRKMKTVTESDASGSKSAYHRKRKTVEPPQVVIPESLTTAITNMNRTNPQLEASKIAHLDAEAEKSKVQTVRLKESIMQSKLEAAARSRAALMTELASVMNMLKDETSPEDVRVFWEEQRKRIMAEYAALPRYTPSS